MSLPRLRVALCVLFASYIPSLAVAEDGDAASKDRGAVFYERKIRPILIQHCYECHSEKAQESQGGLLLDRRSAWLKGGDTQAAVEPGNPDSSLLIEAIRYEDEDLQMPPDGKLGDEEIGLLERWVQIGAPGPRVDLKESEFSRLGDQSFLAEQAKQHWAFQPIQEVDPPAIRHPAWNKSAIDRLLYTKQQAKNVAPSPRADTRTLLRRVTFDLTGLPPTFEQLTSWREAANDPQAFASLVDRLLSEQAFGEHFGRLWLDVARYADTDSFYRPDTRTPHYFPFAFTYRDYVIAAFNEDKPFDVFLREQLAADLIGHEGEDPELAALGFLTVGPYANRNQAESLDDWIDVTTRGLMGVTVACARCHDHKYEPIPTADYYALRGVFASVVRVNPLDEKRQPKISGYSSSSDDESDYAAKRAVIDAKIDKAGGKKSKNNNRSVAQKIRETELAELLLFHPGAPVHTMTVKERPRPPQSYVFLRGDPTRRGPAVPRRFLSMLDPDGKPFSDANSGRLDLANKIASAENPLTARVYVNRVWGHLMGSHLVATPSDFGIQGANPTHPELLDWLASQFIRNGWSTKHLVRTIVMSQAYQQASRPRADMESVDPENQLYWRANRKHLRVEAIRDSLLAVANRLDRTPRGRAANLWGEQPTRRRAIYGYINRFNLDPTLRVFDFPTPMQTQPERRESIVAPQALFTMNSPFVVQQAIAVTESDEFSAAANDAERIRALFTDILQREPTKPELTRITKFVELQQRFFDNPKRASAVKTPWPLVAQSLMMSNEFQYVD